MRRLGAGAGAALAALLTSQGALLAQPANRGGQPLDATKLSKKPVLSNRVEATYPPRALEQKVEADVTLLIDVSATGKVEKVAIAEPTNPPGLGFDEAAMAAARQFEFEPAELDGKPVAVQITYRYKFRLPGEQPGGSSEGGEPTPAGKGEANFKGVLIERGTRQPLAGVTVTVFRNVAGKQVGFEAVTDDKGEFVFFDLEPATWKVLAEPPGYYPLRTSDEVVAGEQTDVTYHIERGIYNPYDVTVTAVRQRKEVSRTVLTSDEVDKIPGTQGDPINAVSNFAGVARVPTLSPNALFGGSFVVRGSSPEDTKILVADTPVPILHHFAGLKSVVAVGVLDSIEFYPGNFAPAYGRATGGIVDVRLKELRPKKVGGYVDVSLLDAGGYIEAPLGDKGGIAVAARRSYIDALLVATVPDDAPVRLVTAPRYYDFQVLASYRPTAKHDLRAFVFGSDDRVEVLFKNPAEVDPALESNQLGLKIAFYRSILMYRFIPSERTENAFQLSVGRDEANFALGQAFFDGDLYTAQLRDTLRHKLTDSLDLSYGVDVGYWSDTGSLNLPQPQDEGVPPGNMDIQDTDQSEFNDRTYWSPAGFAELEWRPARPFMILPGVRVDSLGKNDGEVIVQPRLTARHQTTDTLVLKAGVGMFAQEPQSWEVDANIGNPDLKAERAFHYSAGFELRPTEFLSFDVTGFYKHLYRLVRPTDELVMEDGEAHELAYDNSGKGRVYGMEMTARHEFNNNFTGWLSYTLSRSDRKDPATDEYRRFDYDQPHIITLIASYLLPRNWQVGARFRLASGNPTTPVVGSTFNASSDRYDPIYGAVNSDRINAFHQLDLRVDKRWIYQSWILGAYLDIQNVYNRENPEGIVYNFDFSESQNQAGLPLLTVFGVRGEF